MDIINLFMKKRLIIILIVIVSASVFVLEALKLRSGQTADFGELISTTELTLGDAGNYLLQKYQNGYDSIWILSESNFWQVKRLRIDGFEDLAAVCSRPTFQIDSKNFLCLSGYVGAHSENVVMVELNKFVPIAFADDENIGYNIISDAPYFVFNTASPRKLIVDMRNYDKNPLIDSIRSYYKWNGMRFVFDKSEEITYDEKYSVTSSI